MLTLFPAMRIGTAALSDIAYAVLAGALLNRLWLAGDGSCNRRLRISIGASSAALLLNLPFQLLLLSASMTGDSSWADAWHALPDVVGTHAGRVLVLSFCVAPCFLAFSCFPSSLRKMTGVLIGIFLEASLIASKALSGHAASNGDFTLREGIQFLHLSSIATWGGGILVAGLITLPHLASNAPPEETKKFGKRLSQTVTIALAVVILSGIYNSWKGLGGSSSLLPQTDWGRMLMLKVFFVLLALGHGARVRFLLRRHDPWTIDHTTMMRRWVRLEALLMFLVFVCSAWLANLPPADM